MMHSSRRSPIKLAYTKAAKAKGHNQHDNTKTSADIKMSMFNLLQTKLDKKKMGDLKA